MELFNFRIEKKARPAEIEAFIEPTIEDIKAPEIQTQTKSVDFPFNPSVSFADYLYTNSYSDLFALEAIRLYKKCAPFYDSVDRRATAVAGLDIKLYNNRTEKYEKSDHEVLKLILNPNPTQSTTAFIEAISSYFDSCGEAFVLVTGYDRPLEIFAVSPSYVQAEQTNLHYAPQSYLYSDGRISERFYLDEDGELGGSLRYWNQERTRQLWSIRNFNPLYSQTFRGMSKATPLWLQIQQFVAADTNNYSVLMRGGRPSLVWTWQHTDPMTDPQFERMQAQVKAYEGAINAGRQIIADNVKPENIALTNTEMQFKENREKVRDDIYTLYRIPLALVSSGSMTMDNLKVSNALFYEQAVLPLADYLFGELTRCLMPMFTDEPLEYTYSIFDIPALKERIYNETSIIQKAGILKDNELRTNIGYDEIPGGDIVYKPSTSVPAGTEQQAQASKAEKHRKYLQSVKNTDGTPTYSDEYIENSVMSFYG